jgi:hypothetical protein
MQSEMRKYLDCREINRRGGCSLRISGTEAEVLATALEHAVAAHGYRGWEELRLALRGALKNEREASIVRRGET